MQSRTSILVRRIPQLDNWAMAGMTEFGALLKQRREQLNLRIEDVAASVGRPTSFVWRLEGGKNANPPDAVDFMALANALSLQPRTMLEALGYLLPEDQEPGVAYVVYEGDPRVEMLKVLEGLVSEDVSVLTQALTLLKTYSQKKEPVSASSDQHNATDIRTRAG